jgi:hypothetical protein
LCLSYFEFTDWWTHMKYIFLRLLINQIS